MTQYQEPSELKKAEPWLRQKAERVLDKLFPGEWNKEDDAETVEWILFQLKVAYSEGYADRMKSEVAETKSQTPRKPPRRKR